MNSDTLYMLKVYIAIAILAFAIFAIVMITLNDQAKTDTKIETTFTTRATEPSTTVEEAITAPVTNETTIVTEIPVEPEKPVVRYPDVPLDHDLLDFICALSDRYSFDPFIVIAMIERESSYKADAVGDNGDSLGLMQIQPKWHSELIEELGCWDLLDPYQNIHVGIRIISDLYKTSNNTEWALMAYNGGPEYADRNVEKGYISFYAYSVIYRSIELRESISTDD